MTIIVFSFKVRTVCESDEPERRNGDAHQHDLEPLAAVGVESVVESVDGVVVATPLNASAVPVVVVVAAALVLVVVCRGRDLDHRLAQVHLVVVAESSAVHRRRR